MNHVYLTQIRYAHKVRVPADKVHGYCEHIHPPRMGKKFGLRNWTLDFPISYRNSRPSPAVGGGDGEGESDEDGDGYGDGAVPCDVM